jgi:hypothetical protein
MYHAAREEYMVHQFPLTVTKGIVKTTVLIIGTPGQVPAAIRRRQPKRSRRWASAHRERRREDREERGESQLCGHITTDKIDLRPGTVQCLRSHKHLRQSRSTNASTSVANCGTEHEGFELGSSIREGYVICFEMLTINFRKFVQPARVAGEPSDGRPKIGRKGWLLFNRC